VRIGLQGITQTMSAQKPEKLRPRYAQRTRSLVPVPAVAAENAEQKTAFFSAQALA
jgi:hypothetical protein